MIKKAYVVSFAAGFLTAMIFGKVKKNWLIKKRKDEYNLPTAEQIMEVVKRVNEEVKAENPESPMVEAEYIKLVNLYKPLETTSDISNAPYVISPMEFGDFEDYQTISLTYTSDGVLLDDDDEPLEDVDATVGNDYAKHFGDYPDDPDTVYIRNDVLCCDFEICKDLRSSEDYYKGKPHMTWEE